MANESEIDKEQDELLARMEESREALAQKIERLEEKVTETVENATASVAEVTANVLETVQTATASMTDTVGTVTNAVQGTVDTVRSSLQGGVDSVKEAFDLSCQVEKNPWLMFGGALAAGYVTGLMLQRPPSSASNGARAYQGIEPSRYNGLRAPEAYEQPVANGKTNGNGRYANGYSGNGASSESGARTQASSANSWSTLLTDKLGPEIAKLQSLAIGMAVGAMRDSVIRMAPDSIQKPLGEVIDSVTEKLGGQCLHGDLTSPNSDRDVTQNRQVRAFDLQR
jgi:ElaB/YqjD/DUF883 family membrane-anchored ribosome-binding protein